jgi:adenosylhomocysteine nucleosidase
MEEELALLIEELEGCSEVQFGTFTYYTGRIHEVEVALFLCGIGKVNAAVGATLLIDKLGPDYLINTGVAGGFHEAMSIGDIVISSEVRHHDADATVFDYEFGQIPQMPAAYLADEYLVTLARNVRLNDETVVIHEGNILSGDSFVHHPEQIQNILNKFPDVMAVEMEGAAIAQTSYLFNVPFVLIRSISDKVHEDGSADIYNDCMAKAAENSVKMVLDICKQIDGKGTKKCERFQVFK